jgi:hypothetical protein
MHAYIHAYIHTDLIELVDDDTYRRELLVADARRFKNRGHHLARIHLCVYVCMYVCMYVCKYTYIYIYILRIRIYIYIYNYVYIYISHTLMPTSLAVMPMLRKKDVIADSSSTYTHRA